MTPYEFWYEDEELLNVYVKAFYERTNYNAWVNGYYTYIAQLTASSNTWGGNKGKEVQYPLYNSNLQDKKKIEIKEQPKNDHDNHFLSQFY